MIQTIEAIVDESGRVHLSQPLAVKGVHRAFVTILDEPPINPAQTTPTQTENTVDELFGIWHDHPASVCVDDYVRQQRQSRI